MRRKYQRCKWCERRKETDDHRVVEPGYAWIAGPMSAWALGLRKPKGGSYVVDNRCGTDSSMGARAGEQLHHGWVYPYFARAGNCSDRAQRHPGTKSLTNDLRSLFCRSYAVTWSKIKRVSSHRTFGGTQRQGWALSPALEQGVPPSSLILGHLLPAAFPRRAAGHIQDLGQVTE